MRGRTLLMLAFLVALSAAGCGSTAATTSPPPGEIHRVSLDEFSIRPGAITINVGDTVRWRNTGVITHTSTSGTGGAFPGSSNGIWDSGIMNPGTGFARTFTSAGTFTYFCSLHPIIMGTAVIEVQG